jgi:hypothetical protein
MSVERRLKRKTTHAQGVVDDLAALLGELDMIGRGDARFLVG